MPILKKAGHHLNPFKMLSVRSIFTNLSGNMYTSRTCVKFFFSMYEIKWSLLVKKRVPLPINAHSPAISPSLENLTLNRSFFPKLDSSDGPFVAIYTSLLTRVREKSVNLVSLSVKKKLKPVPRIFRDIRFSEGCSLKDIGHAP